MYYRRRVPQASEKGTTKPTRCADVVVALLITSKSRDVLNVAIPLNVCVTVSYFLYCKVAKSKMFLWFVTVNWSVKAKRRKTTGTGRMRHLKIVRIKFR